MFDKRRDPSSVDVTNLGEDRYLPRRRESRSAQSCEPKSGQSIFPPRTLLQNFPHPSNMCLHLHEQGNPKAIAEGRTIRDANTPVGLCRYSDIRENQLTDLRLREP